ncbi:coproporphyrinogen III oxidase domain protein [[Clostridium] sordellii ATCC 9714]|nr:coproporphyrinogen III oxidase domain protein [[Clostridium] sordellii ATCC 9714] [Paeniclostridium sordellii ATCC 9714]
MLGVELKGHDYKYEVAELLKLFTTQFRFIKDNEEYDKRIINSVNIDSNEVNSLTNYYEGENLVISKQESFDITKLNNEEIKKKQRQ